MNIMPTDNQLSANRDLGQTANQYARQNIFFDYLSRKAKNTIRRQGADLTLFAKYLALAAHQAKKPAIEGDLQTEPASWKHITWGLVQGFVNWQLKEGYTVGSINVRLSTIKAYAKLAHKAGTLDKGEYLLICDVSGFAHHESRKVDEKRPQQRMYRAGKPVKKAEAVNIAPEQVALLKHQPQSPQGCRDTLLMHLLLDHGLRCGEIAGLKVKNFNLSAGELTFYRPKVDKIQTHRLTPATLKAAKAYFNYAPLPADYPVLRSSKKDETLTHEGMSERAITKRVRTLGETIGIEGLSAHDCRHYWATRAARKNTTVDALMNAGGWNSPAMPLRYVKAAKIANEGVNLE